MTIESFDSHRNSRTHHEHALRAPLDTVRLHRTGNATARAFGKLMELGNNVHHARTNQTMCNSVMQILQLLVNHHPHPFGSNSVASLRVINFIRNGEHLRMYSQTINRLQCCRCLLLHCNSGKSV